MEFTCKKGSIRVPNDQRDWDSQLLSIEAMFPILMVEMGFSINPNRDGVWTHSKNKDLSLQLKDQELFFELGYKFEKLDLSTCPTAWDFVEQVLIFTRESYLNNQGWVRWPTPKSSLD